MQSHDRASNSRRFQFSLASLLALQALVGFVLGVKQGVSWPFVIAVTFLPILLTLAVVATVWISGECNQLVYAARLVAGVIVIFFAIGLAITALGVLGGWLP